jgi:CTP:phosphocholine cytidylyltransferase-like protein
MNKITVKHLKKLLTHLTYYNKLSPFPVYDTDYVKDVENRIKEMEQSKENYDELPVVACKYCKSLHIVTDETDNDICFRCGSVNELQEFKNIHEYNKFIHDKSIF